MIKQKQRSRISCAVFVALMIFAGLASRSSLPLPDWFQKYGGDTLWSMMMYGIFAWLFPKAKANAVFLGTLLFSFAIECSQLLQYDWLNALRATPLRYLLGQGFVWSDLVCYSIGCMLAFLLDMISMKWRIKKNG